MLKASLSLQSHDKTDLDWKKMDSDPKYDTLIKETQPLRTTLTFVVSVVFVVFVGWRGNTGEICSSQFPQAVIEPNRPECMSDCAGILACWWTYKQDEHSLILAHQQESCKSWDQENKEPLRLGYQGAPLLTKTAQRTAAQGREWLWPYIQCFTY